MKLYVQSVTSKKTGKLYTALFCDFGYRVTIVSLDKALISELAALPIQDVVTNSITSPIEFKPLQRV